MVGILLGTMVNLRMTIRLLICLITKPVALQIRKGFPPLRPNRKAAKVAISSARLIVWTNPGTNPEATGENSWFVLGRSYHYPPTC